ncbi:MAG: uroporphyrinogen-III synthase [Beijerinckiaceae bacterium]
MRVLVTRPEGDAKATAGALVARGHVPVLAPLFEIVPLPVETGGPFDGVAATSSNALRALDGQALARLATTQLFVVGDATASAARDLGFAEIHSAGGDSDELARLITRMMPEGGKLLRLAGRDRRDDAFTTLPSSFTLTTLVTYDSAAREAFPSGVIGMLAGGSIDAALHFSPRAARHFGDLTQDISLAPSFLHVCISAAARDPRFRRAVVADQPNAEAMLTALDQNGVSS